jgi:ribosome biogenesis GTPase A
MINDAVNIDMLSSVVEEAATIPGIAADALAALRAKVAEHAFNLVVAGEFKRGKSTVINALVGADLLPTGVVPLTSVEASGGPGRNPVGPAAARFRGADQEERARFPR